MSAMAGEATTISQLPVQLLARILAVLHPSQRLCRIALVSTAWHTAAILGTHTASLAMSEAETEAEPEDEEDAAELFDSLSAWLATHSSGAITELHATAPFLRPQPVLQLPALQRLPGLECLHCCGLAVTTAQGSSSSSSSEAGAAAAAAAAAAGADALLPLELSAGTALTALWIERCEVAVRGLAALTQLQSLALVGHLPQNAPIPPDPVTADLSTQLQQALPRLQALLSLRLSGGVTGDEVLQHVSSLSRLQDLMLVDGMFTPASLQQLPQSLTRLFISWTNANRSSKTLNSSTAPGLFTLTGLQALRVQSGGAVSLELLARMTSLRRLELVGVQLQGPGTLSVLTALTQLTCLELPPLSKAVLQSDADTAAVTGFPQLQELDINDTGLRAVACNHLFAAGRQLSQLTQLRTDVDLICGGREASLVAACCTNLATISLARSGSQSSSWDLTGMLRSWQGLQHLTSLMLDLYGEEVEPEAWRALGRLCQLQELDLCFDLESLAGVFQLRTLQWLKTLHVSASYKEGGHGTASRLRCFSFKVEAGQGPDGTTDFSQQLPRAIQQAVLQDASLCQNPEALHAALKAQQQLLAQQEEEILQLRQELKEVQAGLAAVLQQLQGQAGSA